MSGSIFIAIFADWTSSHSTLIVGVVGIVVSGILGPATTAAFSRRNAQRQFNRDLIKTRRDDLRGLLDEAALVLGAGATNLRLLREAKEKKAPSDPALDAWAKSVFPLGQRLRLRIPSDHAVVTAYDAVRDRLADAQLDIDRDALADPALDRYEESRAAFLEAARKIIQAPIDERKEL